MSGNFKSFHAESSKTIKHTLKTLRWEHRRIFKVSVAIYERNFQNIKKSFRKGYLFRIRLFTRSKS